MSNAYIFFNTQVQDAGLLSYIADFGLTPFRYLFRGKTIIIEKDDASGEIINIHRVASFHKNGLDHHSKTGDLHSSSTGIIKTVLAVVALVPGLLLFAPLKIAAYLASDVRKNHEAIQRHLEPVNRVIGTPYAPIQTVDDLVMALRTEILAPERKGRSTRVLVICGENLFIQNEIAEEIKQLKPEKLIFENCNLSCRQGDLRYSLFSPKWLPNNYDFEDATYCEVIKQPSVQEARDHQAPIRKRFPFEKTYHTIFSVVNPAEVK